MRQKTSLRQLGVIGKCRVAVIIETGCGVLLVRDKKNPRKDERIKEFSHSFLSILENVNSKIKKRLKPVELEDTTSTTKAKISYEERVREMITAQLDAREIISDGVYALPGGSVNPQEENDVEGTLIRELNEEINLQVHHLLPMQVFYADENDDRTHIIYLAQVKGELRINPEDSVNGIGFVTPYELLPSNYGIFYQKHLQGIFKNYLRGPHRKLRYDQINHEGYSFFSDISIGRDDLQDWLEIESIGHRIKKVMDGEHPLVGPETMRVWDLAVNEGIVQSSIHPARKSNYIHHPSKFRYFTPALPENQLPMQIRLDDAK